MTSFSLDSDLYAYELLTVGNPRDNQTATI